jgi:hypothetical protein
MFNYYLTRNNCRVIPAKNHQGWAYLEQSEQGVFTEIFSPTARNLEIHHFEE